MYDCTLSRVEECVARGDRTAALLALRAAVGEEQMAPRDAIELMLAVRQCPGDAVRGAIATMRSGPPGAYRFVPNLDDAFA